MVVPSPPSSAKSEMRTGALKRRRDFARSLTPELRAGLEAQLAKIVLPHLIEAKVVGAYHPLKDEISPYPILAALAASQRAALPWFLDRDSRMLFREAPATEASPWGVLQPPASAEALAPDILLVPLVAGDRGGARIGHGKGHYDRFISHLREGGGSLFTIGLAWAEQLLDHPIPADPWDMKLDAIATPAEWIDCR
jgi:5-formyltetrahydrofolate cyclo-ligase